MVTLSLATLLVTQAINFPGSASAQEKTFETAKQLDRMALKRHQAKEYALSGPLFLKAYALSKSPSALWSAGRAFALAADQAKAANDLKKSLEYRKQSLQAFQDLQKNHKLPDDRASRVKAEVIQLKIQIDEDQQLLANLPPAPPPPPVPTLTPESKKANAFSEVTPVPSSQANRMSQWILVGTGVSLGVAAGVVFGMAQSNLSTLKENLADRNEDGLIRMPRDVLQADEDEISFQQNLSLGLGIGGALAAVAGGWWLMSTPETSISAQVSASESSASLLLSGQF